MELKCKFQIVQDGKRVFGKGPCLLLELVDKVGSLSKAANELNMSYSKAWSIINRAEKELGYNLLETYIGGGDGGGSYLTLEAKTLVKTYEAFFKEAEENNKLIFQKYFKDI